MIVVLRGRLFVKRIHRICVYFPYFYIPGSWISTLTRISQYRITTKFLDIKFQGCHDTLQAKFKDNSRIFQPPFDDSPRWCTKLNAEFKDHSKNSRTSQWSSEKYCSPTQCNVILNGSARTFRIPYCSVCIRISQDLHSQ